MTALTSKWSLDPSTLKLSENAELVCAMRFGVEEEDRVQLIAHGMWWTLPLGRTLTDEIIAVRLTPGTTASSSPVLQVTNYEAMTLASSAAYLIPRRVVGAMMGGREHWDRVRALTSAEWDELAAVHSQLGGKDGLSAIRAVATDDALRDAIHDSARHSAALGELLTRIDSAHETSVFRQYVGTAVSTFEAPVPLPDVRCWNAALGAVAFVTNGMLKWHGARRDRQIIAAWSLANQPPGLDSFQGALPSQLAFPYGQSQSGVPLQSAQTLVDNEVAVDATWRADPVWAAVSALVAAGAQYDGAAHMKGAAALQAAGQVERALHALTAAAYWMWVSTQQPFPQLLEGARVLAREARWAEIEEVLSATMTAVGFESRLGR